MSLHSTSAGATSSMRRSRKRWIALVFAAVALVVGFMLWISAPHHEREWNLSNSGADQTIRRFTSLVFARVDHDPNGHDIPSRTRWFADFRLLYHEDGIGLSPFADVPPCTEIYGIALEHWSFQPPGDVAAMDDAIAVLNACLSNTPHYRVSRVTLKRLDETVYRFRKMDAKGPVVYREYDYQLDEWGDIQFLATRQADIATVGAHTAVRALAVVAFMVGAVVLLWCRIRTKRRLRSITSHAAPATEPNQD